MSLVRSDAFIVRRNAIIHNVLTRKSAFIRKAAGTSNEEQIIASNIDTVFICMSLNNDFNIRRIERYLGIAWDSGANPTHFFTEQDLLLQKEIIGWNGDTGACIEHSGKVEETD